MPSARQKKQLATARAKASESAQAVSKLQDALRASSPLSSTSQNHSLDFPGSDTPLAPPSDTEEVAALSAPPQTRTKKRTLSDVSKSETSDISVDKAVKKKPAVRKTAPSKKKPGPKAADAESTFSDAESVTVEKSTKKKRKKTVEQDLDDVEIVPVVEIIFMIPEATSEGNQRVALDSSNSFENAVQTMHETIGCVSVARKPTLAYKMSSAGQKTATVNLRTAKDWSGLITDYCKKVKSKKESVTITVLPENYMFSLRGAIKKAPAIKKGVKKGKMTTIDLENDDTDGGDEGDEGIEDAEKKAMADLDAAYRTCRRAWAVSLVSHLAFARVRHAKVTKLTPPEGGLFHMFHNNNSNNGPPAAYQTPYPHSQWQQLPPMQPGGYGIPGYPGFPMPPLFPQFPPAPTRQPMMSSDPIEEDGISYPSIIDFVETLITKAPQRFGLRDVGETFDSLHFFQINEITSLTAQELGTEKFGSVLLGDAQFLLKDATAEVKRLEKQAKRARH
ncbi:hypothetical protein B0H14DRAFT_2592071 [Mycena olivaceomarginata]|nr:hypothetical protein B0H14DRAFT_2592071 [Mycena olivaceomarginata]